MSGDNELMISLQEWSEHFTNLVHPVALTINRAIAELTATKQQLEEVTKQRDDLVTAGENIMMATERLGAPVSSVEWRDYTIANIAMHSAIKAAKGGES